MTDQIELVELQPQPVAVVRGHVSVAEIPAFLAGAFGEVLDTVASEGLAAAGPPFARYTPVGNGFDVEAGFPTTGVVAPGGRVMASELSGGPVARMLYRGAYAGVGAAYERANGWIAEHGYAPAGPPWESYLDPPEVDPPRTLVSVPCRRP